MDHAAGEGTTVSSRGQHSWENNLPLMAPMSQPRSTNYTYALRRRHDVRKMSFAASYGKPVFSLWPAGSMLVRPRPPRRRWRAFRDEASYSLGVTTAAEQELAASLEGPVHDSLSRLSERTQPWRKH